MARSPKDPQAVPGSSRTPYTGLGVPIGTGLLAAVRGNTTTVVKKKRKSVKKVAKKKTGRRG